MATVFMYRLVQCQVAKSVVCMSVLVSACVIGGDEDKGGLRVIR